jgi:DNA polymerase III gamma/tau subunit
MSLFNKVRPTKLDGLLGQATARTLISGWAKSGEFPHAIGLFGPSGCGKTTAAKIIAKLLGVDKGSVTRITQATESMGVDGVRQAAMTAERVPLYGDVRLIFIDEAHQLTAAAQEALLLPLENPREFAYWILCSTDRNKFIKPLLSRLTCIDFKPLAAEAIRGILRDAMAAADATASPKILEAIVGAANGNARAAIQLLESAGTCGSESAALAMIESGDDAGGNDPEAFEIAKAIFNRMAFKQIAPMLKSTAASAETIRRVTLGYCRAVLLNSGANQWAADVILAMSQPMYESCDNAVLAAVLYNLLKK